MSYRNIFCYDLKKVLRVLDIFEITFLLCVGHILRLDVTFCDFSEYNMYFLATNKKCLRSAQTPGHNDRVKYCLSQYDDILTHWVEHYSLGIVTGSTVYTTSVSRHCALLLRLYQFLVINSMKFRTNTSTEIIGIDMHKIWSWMQYSMLAEWQEHSSKTNVFF